MEFLSIILAAVFINNVVLTQFFGVRPLSSNADEIKLSLKNGLVITVIMTISSVITKLVNDYILKDHQYLQIIIFVFIVTLILELFSLFIEKENKSLLLANTLLLGVALIVSQNGLSLLDTVLYSIGAGLGFSLITVLVDAIRYKYRNAAMPKNYLGNPITFIALGLIALAFYGFNGLF
ncbi:Rnf-Nqr domain containing protein [Helcococcus kunzii]|uniref:Rnf-Nqr domain containing protein n=1 Tax=Helcococcus kunzii TaxID=40091 RepID=UPI0021A2941E|nr:Rnf-Nqr domain containing protein [Helcococcus kunzii]MCT1796718.1 hypothetical protein [Helcococcus kunzii]MCT1988894.1 hypothetical protein [Helcococcus kunzii]